MKIIDVTGKVCNGMWTFGDLFPKLTIEEHSGVCPGFGDYYYTEFCGMHAQTGTYIETPAHWFGFENSYLVKDIPLEKLYEHDCIVLKPEVDTADPSKKSPITLEALEKAAEGVEIRPDDVIVVATGWEKYWMDDAHFFDKSPYFTDDAMHWIIDKKPFMLATDTPAWDNYENPAGYMGDFYDGNILMMVPLVNMDQVTQKRVKITVMPLKADDGAAAPVRTVIIED